MHYRYKSLHHWEIHKRDVLIKNSKREQNEGGGLLFLLRGKRGPWEPTPHTRETRFGIKADSCSVNGRLTGITDSGTLDLTFISDTSLVFLKQTNKRQPDIMKLGSGELMSKSRVLNLNMFVQHLESAQGRAQVNITLKTMISPQSICGAQPLSGHNCFLWNLQHSLLGCPVFALALAFRYRGIGTQLEQAQGSSVHLHCPGSRPCGHCRSCHRSLLEKNGSGQRLSAGGLAAREIKRVLFQHHISLSASVMAEECWKWLSEEIVFGINVFAPMALFHLLLVPRLPPSLSSSPIPLHAWIPLLLLSGNTYLLTKFWNRW